MSGRPHDVIDASVVARWCRFSPPYVDHALKVLDDYQEARIDPSYSLCWGELSPPN